MGRKDFQVKIRGYRIELGEIEMNIKQFSTSIKQVVAEAKEVNGEKVLVAYFTKDSAANIDKTELENTCRANCLNIWFRGSLWSWTLSR